jgi:hypothetical protein
MVKTTIQIEEKTRDKLRNTGGQGESYDSIINRVVRGHTILKFSIVDGDNPRELYMGNPLFDWTDENYDAFLDLALEKIGFSNWRRNILKRIAEKDEWYDEVQRFRNQMKKK